MWNCGDDLLAAFKLVKIGKFVNQWLDGDISSKECSKKILSEGAIAAGAKAGACAGAFAGAFFGPHSAPIGGIVGAVSGALAAKN